jgi:hypothetical protein
MTKSYTVVVELKYGVYLAAALVCGRVVGGQGQEVGDARQRRKGQGADT